MQSWLEGRIWVGKGAQATGMTASLRILSSKADSNTWESFTRSGLKLESVHQESPRSDVFRKRATKPLLNQRQRQKRLTWAVEKKNWTVAQWSKVLFSDESKFCISFGNQGPRVWRKSGEAQNPCCLKYSVKFPQTVMICSGQIPSTGPCQSWPPNNPYPFDWLSLSSPPVAGVWWAHWRRLSCGCRRIIQVDAAHWLWLRSDPPHDCKALWVYSNTQ